MKSVMVNPEALLRARGGAMMSSPAAMNIAKQRAIDELKAIPGYIEAFKKAFPDEADPIVYDNVGRAIALFEATLITPDAHGDAPIEFGHNDSITLPGVTPTCLHAHLQSFAHLG